MITSANFRKCENGWFLTCQVDGRAKDFVFVSWAVMCDWMREHAEAQYAAELKLTNAQRGLAP